MSGDPVADAYRAGKFPRSRIPHYRGLMAKDPEGTRRLLARLAATGADSARGIPSEAAYPREWLRGAIPQKQGRVTFEDR